MRKDYVEWLNANESRFYPFEPPIARPGAIPASRRAEEYMKHDTRVILDMSIMATEHMTRVPQSPGFFLRTLSAEGREDDNFATASLRMMLGFASAGASIWAASMGFYKPVSEIKPYKPVEMLGSAIIPGGPSSGFRRASLSGYVVFGDLLRSLRDPASGIRTRSASGVTHVQWSVNPVVFEWMKADLDTVKVHVPPPITGINVSRRQGHHTVDFFGDMMIEGGVNARTEKTGDDTIVVSPDAAARGNLYPIWRPGGWDPGDPDPQDNEEAGFSRGVLSINGVEASSSGTITIEIERG